MKTLLIVLGLAMSTFAFAGFASADHFADNCDGLLDTNCKQCWQWNINDGCTKYGDCTIYGGEELGALGCHHAY